MVRAGAPLAPMLSLLARALTNSGKLLSRHHVKDPVAADAAAQGDDSRPNVRRHCPDLYGTCRDSVASATMVKCAVGIFAPATKTANRPSFAT